ncbi:uncharacterized protein LOC114286266 isoform X1 [Camellia sinensis]|uniref:uncharacterized protein LOC114286266 isoform X1 n=1 Tax=Camellia sinensis TaxID=4442 RepID=UPI001036E123|nr:uncharacterized protein LOC114286266 isoform X1 [Camellia sinensis]
MHPLIDLIAHLTVSHSLVLHLHRSTLSHRKIGRSTDSRIAPIDLTGLGRIAGILSLEVEDGNTTLDSLQHVGSELAMHVVATKPLFLRKDLVSSDALENERKILKSQVWILKEMIRFHQHFMLWILKEQIRIHQHFMTSMELACVHRNQVSQKGRRNGKDSTKRGRDRWWLARPDWATRIRRISWSARCTY